MRGNRTRTVGLLLSLCLLLPLPVAGAEVIDEEPLHEPLMGFDSLEVSADAVVYDMYFPIQGGAEYSDNFGDCRSGCSRTHHGIDIMLPKMTPVLAVASGTVRWIHDNTTKPCCAFALRHDDGWESWYIHLNNDTPGTDDGQGWGFAPGIENGARVTAGQLVGWVGDSGNAEGCNCPHLHFELHQPGDVVINPYHSLNAATVLNAPIGDGNARACDYDNDGFDDLAIGTPGEDIAGNSKIDAGAVTVLYGTPSGLGTAGVQHLTQRTDGVRSAARADEEFGFTTGCGDVNKDGFDDLIVGVPGEAVRGNADSGAINLILGSAGGLVASGSNFWHQNRGGVGGAAKVGDRFGEALAVGDFDNDGFADVAVGVPGKAIGGHAGSGMVTVLYGSESGFTGRSVAFHENRAGIGGRAEPGDMFGAGLAAGDFDNDGFSDLAIGLPGEDSGINTDSGAVVTLYGSESGLSAAREERFTQKKITGERGNGEMFGAALTSGDFDEDGHMDLAIGVPGDLVGDAAAGGVNVLYGSELGLTATGDQLFQQGIAGVRGDSVAGDLFGAALTYGDFDADGTHDLAIGVPGKTVAGVANAGSVAVIYGTEAGLDSEDDGVWSQHTPGIKGGVQAGDRFGQWLSSGNYNGVGVSSLAIGVPLEDIGANTDAGATHVIVGWAESGLNEAGDQHWDQHDPGMPGGAEAGDNFGHVAAFRG